MTITINGIEVQVESVAGTDPASGHPTLTITATAGDHKAEGRTTIVANPDYTLAELRKHVASEQMRLAREAAGKANAHALIEQVLA